MTLSRFDFQRGEGVEPQRDSTLGRHLFPDPDSDQRRDDEEKEKKRTGSTSRTQLQDSVNSFVDRRFRKDHSPQYHGQELTSTRGKVGINKKGTSLKSKEGSKTVAREGHPVVYEVQK